MAPILKGAFKMTDLEKLVDMLDRARISYTHHIDEVTEEESISVTPDDTTFWFTPDGKLIDVV